MLDVKTSFEETRLYKDIEAKGKHKRDIEIAKNMLKEGYEIKAIAKVTGLSEKEIAELS